MADTFGIQNRLTEIIERRKDADGSVSYVARLFELGREKIAEKVGEEATETVIAAVKDDKNAIVAESADLMFHLMILLADAGLTMEDVLDELARREGIGGHEEKASRQ